MSKKPITKPKYRVMIYGELLEVRSNDALVGLVPKQKESLWDMVSDSAGMWKLRHFLNVASDYEEARGMMEEYLEAL